MIFTADNADNADRYSAFLPFYAYPRTSVSSAVSLQTGYGDCCERTTRFHCKREYLKFRSNASSRPVIAK